MLVRQPVDGYIGTCAAIRDADFTEAASRIAVPAICVVGDQDGSTPPDLVLQLAKLIPALALRGDQGCGAYSLRRAAGGAQRRDAGFHR